MEALKTAIQKIKIDGVVDQFFAITSYDAVGKEFDANGNILKSLRDDLEAFTAELLKRATNEAVTEEIRQACENLYNRITGNVGNNTIDEAYDTLKEIADWIGTHGNAAATMTNEISTLRTNVENLTQQIAAKTSITVEESETNGNIKVDGAEVPVYRNPGKNIFVASTTAEATAAEAKMQNGDMLFQIVPEVEEVKEVELKDATEEEKISHNFIGDLATLVSTNKLTLYSGTRLSYTKVDGVATKATIPNYKYGVQFHGNVEKGNILYLDRYRIYGIGFSRVDLSTGHLQEGSSMVTFPDIILPSGYYKIKDITVTTEIMFNIIAATFDSSGNVTQITKDTFNRNNEMVEYLGESYPLTTPTGKPVGFSLPSVARNRTSFSDFGVTSIILFE